MLKENLKGTRLISCINCPTRIQKIEVLQKKKLFGYFGTLFQILPRNISFDDVNSSDQWEMGSKGHEFLHIL